MRNEIFMHNNIQRTVTQLSKFQAAPDRNISHQSMEGVNGNNTSMAGMNQTLAIDCGLMSEEIENTYMSCSFWMEGVLIICTSKKIGEYLLNLYQNILFKYDLFIH